MDIFRENGLMMQLKKAIVERVMKGKLTTELGYEKHDPAYPPIKPPLRALNQDNLTAL